MRKAVLLAIAGCLILSGCYGMRPSAGGGSLSRLTPERKVNQADIALPSGYFVEAVATGLTFPTGVAFDERGTPYVVEAGYSYGEVWDTPRLLRIDGGKATAVAQGGKNGPWTGVARLGGDFIVAEGGELEGGRILRITEQGKISALIDTLPTRGDHHTNGPAIGPDGLIYFGLGTATNSAVVGDDNRKFGWLQRYPDFHDTPCRDLTLTGVNYTTEQNGTTMATGAFSPFGTATTRGQVIAGKVPCSGAVLRPIPHYRKKHGSCGIQGGSGECEDRGDRGIRLQQREEKRPRLRPRYRGIGASRCSAFRPLRGIPVRGGFRGSEGDEVRSGAAAEHRRALADR